MERDSFITSYGFFATIVVTVVGIGIFSYPRELASFVGGDVWVVTIGAGLINILLLRLVIKSIEVNGFKRVTVIVRDNLGSMVGGFILILMSTCNIVAISLGMRAFVEVVKIYLLEKTPTEFLLIVTILSGLYIVRGGIRSNLKFNELSLWLMFIPMILILLFTVTRADFTNILPVFHNKPQNYIIALKDSVFAFGGLEIIYLMVPLLKNKEKAFKNVIRSVSFIVIFYLLVAVLCIAVLSTAEAKKLLWPMITMVRTINIPGSFVERWDGIVMALWIMFYFTTFSNGFTYSSYLISDAVGVGDIRISSIIIVPFIYIIAMLPNNISELYAFINAAVPIGLILNMIILPLILIITSRNKIKDSEKRGEER